MTRKYFVFITAVLWAALFAAGGVSAQNIEQTTPQTVRVLKDKQGAWQMRVNGAPYFVKGVVFSPVHIGESPNNASMRDWMQIDDNKDGINDIAFQTWLDTDRDGVLSPQDEVLGDFELLRRMGANTIRLYHAPSDHPILGNLYRTNPSTRLQFGHGVNKPLLRRLYSEYGIRVIVGNFLGSWTIGSGAAWDESTDYTNPVHRENIKKSVKAMVLDNKDEPYVLFWLLGNENNIAAWSQCNAASEPEAYASLVGELAAMIHELDPNHPVAVSEGDPGHTRNLALYAKHAPQIDILCFNSYRGAHGFGLLWKETKRTFDRPIVIGEFGMFAYNTQNGEDDQQQLDTLKGAWKDIVHQSADYHNPDQEIYSGNSLGGVVFDWVDRWYMDGSPSMHNGGKKYWPTSPDRLDHEEWFGLMSMGDGKDSLLRWPRKAYHYLSGIWNRKELTY